MSTATSSLTKTQRMVGLAIFTAVIIVLQLVATFVKVGPISITLTLVPIVVGAAVYGKGAGAYKAEPRNAHGGRHNRGALRI